jgi:hypothetical protein
MIRRFRHCGVGRPYEDDNVRADFSLTAHTAMRALGMQEDGAEASEASRLPPLPMLRCYATTVRNGTSDLTKVTMPSKIERNHASHPRLRRL